MTRSFESCTHVSLQGQKSICRGVKFNAVLDKKSVDKKSVDKNEKSLIFR